MGRSVKFLNIQWNWGLQNDSSEFFFTLLKALRGKVHPQARPIIKGLFSFQMTQSLYCPNPNCKAVSSQTNPYNTLAIGLHQPQTLKQMLRAYFALEINPGWRCSHCNRVSGAQDLVQGLRMYTTPDILVIDLKRFTPIGNTGHVRKYAVHIPLTQTLDLTPYTVNNHTSRYQLQSVVHHSGTLKGGHYVAVCKGPGDNWVELNDETATGTDVRSALSPEDDFTPYILFYVRKGGPAACASLPADLHAHLG